MDSGGYKDIAPADVNFSYIDIVDLPGPAGSDGLAEIALWIHDTGKRIESKWSGGTEER